MERSKFLRKKYPKFIYRDYSYRIRGRNLEVFFDFEISPGIKFRPRIIIKYINKKRLKAINKELLNNFIFHLGLMEIPTYWKVTCSPLIEIRAGYLSKEQIRWWRWFILRGMGQFFYENKIDFRKPNFLKILSHQQKFGRGPSSPKLGEDGPLPNFRKTEFLTPIGEGKDSIVTLELLKKQGKEINCFVVNPTEQHFKILKIAGIKNPVIVERKIDPVLLKLNRAGYLNGHTPITAVISNLAVFAAALFGFGNVAMSCERSANEGNVKYLGKTINHQWSKSFEFEKKFRDYLSKYLINYSLIRANKRIKTLNYFSFLRPLYEIQIAKIFAGFPKYFSVFLSCNEARKTKSGAKKPIEKWCGKCPKCLFVWTILYPFAGEKKLVEIFGKNLFGKKELLPIMKELIGEEKTKPFECVGTKKESAIAFYFARRSFMRRRDLPRRSFMRRRVKPPFLLNYFEKEILPKYPNIEKKSKIIMNSWDKHNYLPKILEKALRLQSFG